MAAWCCLKMAHRRCHSEREDSPATVDIRRLIKGAVMSMHFICHRWEVTTAQDGIMVAFDQQDLDPPTLSVLIDDLFELAQESGQTNFYLNFAKVHLLPSIALAKL